MREKIVEYIKKCVKNNNIDSVIDYCFDEGIINPTSARNFLIRQEFYKIKQQTDKKESNIILILSDKFKLTDIAIYYILHPERRSN